MREVSPDSHATLMKVTRPVGSVTFNDPFDPF
jgi:hypothetical protein